MPRIAGDTEIKRKGLKALFKEPGEADAIRFLSQAVYYKKFL